MVKRERERERQTESDRDRQRDREIESKRAIRMLVLLMNDLPLVFFYRIVPSDLQGLLSLS